MDSNRAWREASGTLPPREVLATRVYEAMLSLVMDGALPPGERINIDDVARRLNVSPSPVREALVRLENEGLAVKRGHSAGYAATPVIDADGLTKMFAIRLRLEPWAAGLAAESRVPDDLDELAAIVEEMREPVDGTSYAGYRRFAHTDAQFHQLIARIGGGRMLGEVLQHLQPHIHAYRLQPVVGAQALTTAQHARILAH